MPSADWKCLGLLAVIVLAACFPLMLGRFYLTGDVRDVTLPLESFFHAETVAGRLPVWNPDIAWGFPVLAAAQIGYFYPPLLLLRFLPVSIYMPLVLVGHLLALAIGCFLYFRLLAYSRAASIFGAIVFTGSAFIWQHITHFNISLSIAWFPWQLLAAHYLAREPKRVKKWIAWCAVLGLPLLIGQVQMQIWCGLVSGLYFLYESWQCRTISKHTWLGLLATVGVVLGLSAALWLPLAELLPFSSRGAGGDFSLTRANQHSYPLYHLPTLLWPHFYGTDSTYWGKRLEIEYGLFIGTLPLLFAGFALFTRLRRQLFWSGTVIVTFLLALGSLSPFRLLGLEPSLWVFSAPARWLLFTTFGLSVLAVEGFEALTHTASREKLSKLLKRSFLTLTAVVVIANGILALIQSWPAMLTHYLLTYGSSIVALTKEPAFYQEKMGQLLTYAQTTTVSLRSPFTYLPLLVLTAAFFFSKRSYLRSRICAVTALELGIIIFSMAPTVSWQQVLSSPPTLAHLPPSAAAGQARIFSVRSGGDTGAYFTDPASRANTAIRTEQKNLLIPLLHSLYHIPGVEWPASLDFAGAQKTLSGFTIQDHYLITDLDKVQALNIGAVLMPVSLGELPALQPAAVENGIAIYNIDARPRAEVYLANGETVPALYDQITPTHVHISVTAPAAGTLVVRDSAFPGWQATVDGRAVGIEHYNLIFRSLPLAAGSHTIDMVYVPTRVYQGAAISLATGIILVISLFFFI